jgi:hypothetical protein
VTVTQPDSLRSLQPVTVDLYQNIHKGIRAELFAVTAEAGRLDPANGAARAAHAAHVEAVVGLLRSHATHEDVAIEPALELHLPDLARKIASDHAALEPRMDDLQTIARESALAARTERRASVHRLYLELASFTGTYLEHQDVEERQVMPALEAAIGVEAVAAIEQAILSSIPPDEMARSLAVMLPAMNVDDQAELLGGMKAGAPPEVFAGVWGLAGGVLSEPDHSALAQRLGLS